MPDENKWPDLRGFVDNEHRKGRRVLLWFKMWNNEGLDESECVMDLCRPVAADPTSPRYRDRVKKMMYRLLSDDADCYNCDGFKIDFANCMPLGETVESSGGKYGVELLKQLSPHRLPDNTHSRNRSDPRSVHSLCNGCHSIAGRADASANRRWHHSKAAPRSPSRQRFLRQDSAHRNNLPQTVSAHPPEIFVRRCCIHGSLA